MSFARGERVLFDFDSGAITSADDPNYTEESEEAEADAPEPTTASSAFVFDILERNTSTAAPPAAPTLKTNSTGFPEHKKRTNRVSAFKQQRAGRKDVPLSSDAPKKPTATEQGQGEVEGDGVNLTEREQIDKENRDRLAGMTEDEILKEQEEILSTLSPALVQRLLARANLDEGSNERDWEKDIREDEAAAPVPPPTWPRDEPEAEQEASSPTPNDHKPKTNFKKVSFADDEAHTHSHQSPPHSDDTHQPLLQDQDQDQDQLDILPPSSIHFPTPHQPPDLDPNSPSFLTDLHTKYFPTLPYDPSSLSWMKPLDPTDTSSPYHVSHPALNASDLRFNFRGALLAPSAARQIPVTQGLHHHAEAPEAAGYTIPELARLARSKVAAQRCVAYQTLGRVLYRLGRGEFGDEAQGTRVQAPGPVQVATNGDADGGDGDEDEGDANANGNEIAEDEDVGSALAGGLWKCIDEGKVVEILTEEAGRERGHLTARTYAQEALWNWRRGGGRKRMAV